MATDGMILKLDNCSDGDSSQQWIWNEIYVK
jgi:hypothetical protein